MNQGNEQPGFWALIPASVRYDKELPPNAKLLYGEVTARSDKLGYCYAQNSYFSDLFGLSERSVTRLLSTLVDRGYLRVDVVRDTATQEVLERRIYAIYNTEGAGAPPPDKNVGTPPDNFVTTPPDKNVGEINTRSDRIPPIAVSYTHLRAHETDSYLVCRLLLEKNNRHNPSTPIYCTLGNQGVIPH